MLVVSHIVQLFLEPYAVSQVLAFEAFHLSSRYFCSSILWSRSCVKIGALWVMMKQEAHASSACLSVWQTDRQASIIQGRQIDVYNLQNGLDKQTDCMTDRLTRQMYADRPDRQTWPILGVLNDRQCLPHVIYIIARVNQKCIVFYLL